MKVAYFAESPADAVPLTILTEAILGTKTETIRHKGLESRGWPSVRTVLRSVLLELHYQTDAEGFVLIVDSNGAPPHFVAHEEPQQSDVKCRWCQLRRIADESLRGRARPGRQPLKVAIGLAVPMIEAWLLCGSDSQITEAAWANGLKEGREPYPKLSLKEKLYGSSRESSAIKVEAMKKAAERLALNMKMIESAFPHGFGALAKDLRSWRA